MNITIDDHYMLEVLKKLIEIPSPSGFTDEVVRFIKGELDGMGVPYVETLRGALRASPGGIRNTTKTACIAHVDSLGATVKELKPSGRLKAAPIGGLTPRGAEWARVTIFSDSRTFRGTVLPVKASVHVHRDEVNTQKSTWDDTEIRLDERVASAEDLSSLGVNVGDIISLDPGYEVTDSGFINSRFLDDKAGVAVLLSVLRVFAEADAPCPDFEVIITNSEETGAAGSHVVPEYIEKLVVVDCSIQDPKQNTSEYGVTLCFQDAGMRFSRALNRELIEVCEKNSIPFTRDVFSNYATDAYSVYQAGGDLLAALVCFAADASHAYERTHIDSLASVARLVTGYLAEE